MEIRLGQVHDNDRLGAFAARVDIRRGTATCRYPCPLPRPADPDGAILRDGPMRQALRMPDSAVRRRAAPPPTLIARAGQPEPKPAPQVGDGIPPGEEPCGRHQPPFLAPRARHDRSCRI
jgi:hypothetical protein